MPRKFPDTGEDFSADPIDICPECGALWKERRNCQQIFDEFLVLEFANPEFGEVHFLTVACYMIQHRRYGRQAMNWIEGKLRDNLERGISPDEIRRQAVKDAAQDNRDWKVQRQAGEEELPPLEWSKRITDIVCPMDDPARYREEITSWAEATLAEMEGWRDEN